MAASGIDNGVNLAVQLLILFAVVFWVALVFWTYRDARRRIEDPMLIGCATAASLFPFVGTIIYTIVRPPEYLDDVRERELEIRAAEARLAQVGYHLCPHCDYEVEKDYLRCPSCMRKLKDPCGSCGKPLDPAWKLCPYCEAEVGSAQSPRRVRRRRDPSAGEVSGREVGPAPSASRSRAAAPRDQVVRDPASREGVYRDPAAREVRSRDLRDGRDSPSGRDVPSRKTSARRDGSGEGLAREPMTRKASSERTASEKRSS